MPAAAASGISIKTGRFVASLPEASKKPLYKLNYIRRHIVIQEQNRTTKFPLVPAFRRHQVPNGIYPDHTVPRIELDIYFAAAISSRLLRSAFLRLSFRRNEPLHYSATRSFQFPPRVSCATPCRVAARPSPAYSLPNRVFTRNFPPYHKSKIDSPVADAVGEIIEETRQRGRIYGAFERGNNVEVATRNKFGDCADAGRAAGGN